MSNLRIEYVVRRLHLVGTVTYWLVVDEHGRTVAEFSEKQDAEELVRLQNA
jgi:hypothetical protein